MSILSEMIHNVVTYGVEFVFRRYYGIYPATVWDNKDKEGMGRVKVQSFIFGHSDGKELAKHNGWVIPAWPDMIYDPPEIGSEVWIQFICGDINRPVYVGTRKIPGDARFGEFQQKNISPTKRAIKTKAGHTIAFYDGDNARVEIIAAGNTIVLDKDGVKINGSFLVTEKLLDFMNNHIVNFGLGGLGEPIPLNPVGTAPDFIVGNTTPASFKTDKIG